MKFVYSKVKSNSNVKVKMFAYRLEAYDRNHNFCTSTVLPAVAKPFLMNRPSDDQYKDISDPDTSNNTSINKRSNPRLQR